MQRQGDLQPQPFTVRLADRRDRQLARVVVREEGLLRSFSVDHLAEVALLVEQSDAHHRHAEVAAGLELIAGHVAEATRVDG